MYNFFIQIFIAGLPQKYKDSVRAITPGLPLFLYNYTSHQLHGVFQVHFKYSLRILFNLPTLDFK